MDTWDVLRNIWFLLIGVLLAGYSILDGFDLGVGALFPFLAKTEDEKRTLIGAVGPVWDGNEVWLLAGGGALFAAFPMAYATVFSGFYLALMLVLFALILRAVSLEFRAHDPARRGLWEAAFVGGSVVPALLFGVALGNVVGGVPLDARRNSPEASSPSSGPCPSSSASLGSAPSSFTAAAYAALKTAGRLRLRAQKTALAMAVAFGAAFVLSLIAVWIYLPTAVKSIRPGFSPRSSGVAWPSSSRPQERQGRPGFLFLVDGLPGPVGDRRRDPVSEPRPSFGPGPEPDDHERLVERADAQGHAHHRPRRHAARHRLHDLRLPRLQGQGRRRGRGILAGRATFAVSAAYSRWRIAFPRPLC